MARKLGLRSAGQTLLFILGAALLFAAPFALEATGQIDEATLGLALAAIAFSAAALAMLRSGQAAEAAKRSAGEAEALSQRLLPVLDTLSQRLLRLESRLTYQAAGEGAPRLEATVAEVSSEISVLGQLVRDLAVALAAQDRDVAVLKDQVTRVAGPGLAPRATASAPPPVAPPRPSEKLVTPTLFPMPEPAPPVVAPRRDEGDEASAEEARRVAAVAEAFEADRIELHLQPVVGLPQRKIRMYEVLSRLRLSDETLLVPAEFLPVLEERGLMPELDRRVLVRSAAIVRHLSARGSDALVSCNLSPASLARPGFLRDAGRLLDEAPELAGRLVLEVPQRCWRMLDAEQAGVLGQLRERGLAFALDGATDMRIDPLALADRGVRYVKLPAEMLLEPGARRGLDVEVSDLAAVLSRAGISLVAERVEREEDVPNLLDLDVPLAQGFVFSPPRPVRAEVLEGPSASPAAPVPASASEPEKPNPQEPEAEKLRPPPPAAEGRRSFRSFLRRAG